MAMAMDLGIFGWIFKIAPSLDERKKKFQCSFFCFLECLRTLYVLSFSILLRTLYLVDIVFPIIFLERFL